MNEINNILQNVLVYDLQNIVIDYLDDTYKNNYKKVIDEYELMVVNRIEDNYDDRDFCIEPGCGIYNECGELTFNEMKKQYPECYDKHIVCLNELANNGNLFYLNDWKHKEGINELNNVLAFFNQRILT